MSNVIRNPKKMKNERKKKTCRAMPFIVVCFVFVCVCVFFF